MYICKQLFIKYLIYFGEAYYDFYQFFKLYINKKVNIINKKNCIGIK